MPSPLRGCEKPRSVSQPKKGILSIEARRAEAREHRSARMTSDDRWLGFLQPVEGNDERADELSSHQPTSLPEFRCTVCGGHEVNRTLTRGDGVAILFCKDCGMGLV